MCQSPNHASNVPLVLNTHTGNTSPQFHCIDDNEFSTCKRDAKFKLLWQIKAKLQEQPVTLNQIDSLPTQAPTAILSPERHSEPISLLPSADPLPQFTEQWSESIAVNDDAEPHVETVPNEDLAPEPPEAINDVHAVELDNPTVTRSHRSVERHLIQNNPISIRSCTTVATNFSYLFFPY
jgi:hypothetical protein